MYNNNERKKLDIEQRKYKLDEQKVKLDEKKTKNDLIKWLIAGIVMILLIKPLELNQSSRNLKLQAITVYLNSFNTNNVDLWQRKLEGIEIFLTDLDCTFFCDVESDKFNDFKHYFLKMDSDIFKNYVQKEKERLKKLLTNLDAANDYEYTYKVLGTTKTDKKEIKDLINEQLTNLNAKQKELQNAGIRVDTQEYPYTFVIAGSFLKCEEAQKSADRLNNILKDTIYKVEVYKLQIKRELYVVQLDVKNITLPQINEGFQRIKNEIDTTFIFKSRTPRTQDNVTNCK